MPRSIWTGAISFGLVNVPVKLYSAVSKKTVRFHQLHESDGVRIQNGASGNAVGGTVAGAGNTIVNNGGTGVTVGTSTADPATGNAILGNSIFSNGSLAATAGGSWDGATQHYDRGELRLWDQATGEAPGLRLGSRRSPSRLGEAGQELVRERKCLPLFGLRRSPMAGRHPLAGPDPLPGKSISLTGRLWHYWSWT